MLEKLRKASLALDLVTVRGLMIGIMTHQIPEVFEKQDKNGKHFTCFEAFVRRFLKHNMHWTLQRATRTGQKIPINVDELLHRTTLCAGATIRDEDILAVFVVNTDQTQVVYSSGRQLTYNICGEKQVEVEGSEEKRAFTAIVGISMRGEVLPFQVIYQGSDQKQSLPKLSANILQQAEEYSFCLKLSKTKTYWSTQETMRTYLTDILAPYFTKHKDALGHSNQKCLWLIDVWSVHRSIELRT